MIKSAPSTQPITNMLTKALTDKDHLTDDTITLSMAESVLSMTDEALAVGLTDSVRTEAKKLIGMIQILQSNGAVNEDAASLLKETLEARFYVGEGQQVLRQEGAFMRSEWKSIGDDLLE